MGALLQLLQFASNEEQKKYNRQQAEVRAEAYRRTQNRIAEQEGKALAMREQLDNTASAMTRAELDLQITQRQYDEARRKNQLNPEQNELYSNAINKLGGDLEYQRAKYRELTIQRGHMDGTLNKTIAGSSKPMFDKIFNPNADPYDQITEERKTKTEAVYDDEGDIISPEREVTQKGPASAFAGRSAYGPAPEDTYTAPATASSLLGFTPSGFQSDPYAVTPEFSYRPVRNTGGVTTEEDTAGAIPVDVTSTQPNPDPVASQQTNPAAQAPKIGNFIRVRNKVTGETGTMPKDNGRAAIASGRYEQIP